MAATHKKERAMGIYDGMLPKEHIEGKIGYYPVTNAKEWDELPAVYKAMDWFPVEVYNYAHRRRENTVAEYVEFDVIYMEPYKIRATVKVHVQEVQKILFCLFENAQCYLYSISGVVFANGVRWPAEWRQDTRTGSYSVYASGLCVGRQGGYMGFVPCQIDRTEEGFKWAGFRGENRCHYTLLNPFTGR